MERGSTGSEIDDATAAQSASCKLISEFLETKFSTLDANVDEFVSDSELTQFALNKQTSNTDYKIALATRDLATTLEGLHWEFSGITRPGFSIADVRRFAKITNDAPDDHLARSAHYAMLKNEQDADRFFQLVKDFRPQIDSDGDGRFSLTELDTFAKNAENRTDARAATEFLLKRSAEITRLGSSHSTAILHSNIFRTDPSPGGISERHLLNMQLLRMDAKEFTDAMKQCRTAERKGGTLLAALSTIGAAVCLWQSRMSGGLGRVGFLAGTALGAGVAIWSAGHVAVDHCQPLVRDYLDQRQRVNSWKYFSS